MRFEGWWASMTSPEGTACNGAYSPVQSLTWMFDEDSVWSR